MPIKFYEKPLLLPEHEIKPGHVIEALPGSTEEKVARIELDNKLPPFEEVQIFIVGYVRGKTEQASGSTPQNTFVLERILPDRKPVPASALTYWGKKDVLCYLTIGELEGIVMDSNKDAYRFSTFSGAKHVDLQSDACTVPLELFASLQKELFEYHTRRKGLSIVFRTPDGKRYSLKDLVIGLELDE